MGTGGEREADKRIERIGERETVGAITACDEMMMMMMSTGPLMMASNGQE